jgi:dTDP-4-dehydrorhamnose reductase
MRKKILIIGSSGLFGQNIKKKLQQKNQVVGTFYKNKINEDDIFLQLNSKENLKNIFKIVEPEIVLNVTNVYKNLEFCEQNKKLALSVNGNALKIISKLCNLHNSHLISLSSDFVFDGSKGNYNENDEICPINYYGKSKALGERHIQDYADRFCIVRTGMIFGQNPVRKTFSEFVLEKIKNHEKFNAIKDQFLTPTYLENLSNMVVDLVEKKIEGIIHLAGSTRLSKFELGKMLLQKFDLNATQIYPVSKKEFSFGDLAPYDSSLDSTKATKILTEKPLSIHQTLDYYRNSYFENAP